MAVWKGNVVILILYMIVESISVSVPQYNIYTYHTYIYIHIILYRCCRAQEIARERQRVDDQKQQLLTLETDSKVADHVCCLYEFRSTLVSWKMFLHIL